MLNTVKVPKEYESLFKQAEDKVRRYFEQQKSDPEQGTIEIRGSRYVLVRAAAFSVEFFQLVRKVFGNEHLEEADLFVSSLLYELAHSVGRSDAKNFHEKMELSDPISKLSAGPIHFSHSGWAFVDIDAESVPTPDEDFCMVYRHPFSFECDSWLSTDVNVEHPVCIMNAGYSSGWCQESFGIPLESREITCRSIGHEDCLFIMAQPHLIEVKIKEYIKKHPELVVADNNLSFMSHKDELLQVENTQNDFRSTMKQRLLAYARNLEATQQQLSDNIQRLESEIQAKEKVEQELQESERHWRELSDATFDAILIAQNEQVIKANRASEKLFHMHHSQIEGHPLNQLFSEEDYIELMRAVDNSDKELTNMQLIHPEGEKFVDIHIHRTEFNQQTAVMLAIRDITERAIAMQRLERLANYDALTGLPNRTRFQGIVNRSLMDSHFNKKHGMLFLDLDNFKTVNDHYGHSAGDLLLFEVADRMTHAIRSENTICRLGGDEFAIWIPDMDSKKDAAEVAKQVLQALERSIEINRQNVNCSFSIGIAVYPKDGTDFAVLTRNSDVAMYEAKKKGKNQFCFYSEVD